MSYSQQQTLPHRDTIVPELQVHFLFSLFEGDINVNAFRNHGKFAVKLLERAMSSL